MNRELLQQALETEHREADFIDQAPGSWDARHRRTWAQLEAATLEIVRLKKAIRQALEAELAKPEQVHDEDLLEQLYWEFDGQRKRSGDERFVFKGKMRFYASSYSEEHTKHEQDPVAEIVCEDWGKPFNAMQIRTHFFRDVPPVGTKLYTAALANQPKQTQADRLYKAVERLALQAGEDAAETIDWLCGEHGGMFKLFEAYFSPKLLANQPETPGSLMQKPVAYIGHNDLKELKRTGRRCLVLYDEPVSNGLDIGLHTSQQREEGAENANSSK